MKDPFQGNDKITKFQAVSNAFAEAFAKPINRGRDLKLELLTYKTVGLLSQEPQFTIISSFPSTYSINTLRQTRPDGGSPMLEALKQAAIRLGKGSNDKKAIAIITGDSVSNYELKTTDIGTQVIPTLMERKIAVSILQAGSSREQQFGPLNQALQNVIITQALIEPKMALTVTQIKYWIRAFTEKF